MKLVILAAALASSGLGSATPLLATASPSLSMNVAFSPNPPKRGTEVITVQLHGGSGKPVNGARVMLASDMPSMSMRLPAVQAAPKGNGRYVASVKIAFATHWAFTVSANVNGKTTKRTVSYDVK